MTGAPVRPRRGPLRRLREIGAGGRLTFAANVAAGLTWLARGLVVVSFVLDDAAQTGDLASVGAGLGVLALLPFAVTAVVAACVATASVAPLGIRWFRGDAHPMVPGAVPRAPGGRVGCHPRVRREPAAPVGRDGAAFAG